jgi:hypothetical protein
MKLTYKWRGRADFAEIAEALDVTTEAIMAAMPDGDEVFVLWTPKDSDPGDLTIVSGVLQRGTDGVLFLASGPQEQPGMWEEITSTVERRLKDTLGEGS